MSIKHKLGLSFGAMVGLILLLAVLSWQNMRRLGELATGHERLLLMQQDLLEARRHEKNYLLRHGVSWVEQNRSRIDRLGHTIQEELSRAVFSDQVVWKAAETLVQAYQKYFWQLVEKQNLPSAEKVVMVDEHLVPTARRLHSILEKQIILSSSNQKIHLAYAEKVNAILVVFAMLASGMLVFLFMRSLLSSLKVGIRFAQEISSGNLLAKVPNIPQDEISILLDAMQKMGRNLQRMEDDTIRTQTARLALSALLETSLEPLSLQEQLEVALRIILTIPHLHLENKGSVFLVNETNGSLHMAASHGLTSEVITTGSGIPAGRCLGDPAASECRWLFSANGDDDHATHCGGMKPQGRCCVPIISRGRVLGVITLYLHANHSQTPEAKSLLASIAFTIAGILERKRIEERLQHLAHHDLLTNLPNRVLFNEHLTRSLAIADRDKDLLAVMLIDLDRFKHVNDTLGHAAGDHVLVMTTQRILECLRASDLIARMGGDEFAVILANLPHPEAAERVAGKIVECVCQPINWAEKSVVIGASIGIALFPEHGRDVHALMTSADMAMYRVKERGRNAYCFYNENAVTS